MKRRKAPGPDNTTKEDLENNYTLQTELYKQILQIWNFQKIDPTFAKGDVILL